MTTKKDTMPEEIWARNDEGFSLWSKESQATPNDSMPEAKYHHERVIQAKDAEIEKLKAARAWLAAQDSGMVAVPQSALDWLFGSGPDENGHWFDCDNEPTIKVKYWWRSKFRAMIAAAPVIENMPSELERLLCNYTRNDRNAVNRFLGAAELCGYTLTRATPATDNNVENDRLFKALEQAKNAMPTEGDALDKMYGLIESLASHYKGYLPDIDRPGFPLEKVNVADTKTRQMYIEDTMKKALKICRGNAALYPAPVTDAQILMALDEVHDVVYKTDNMPAKKAFMLLRAALSAPVSVDIDKSKRLLKIGKALHDNFTDLDELDICEIGLELQEIAAALSAPVAQVDALVAALQLIKTEAMGAEAMKSPARALGSVLFLVNEALSTHLTPKIQDGQG